MNRETWIRALLVIACYILIDYSTMNTRKEAGNFIGSVIASFLMVWKFGGYFMLMPRPREFIKR